MLLRPSFATLARGVRLSSSLAPLKGAPRPALRLPVPPLKPAPQATRGVRTSPYRPSGNASSGSGLGAALSLPHQSPAPGAPTSVSQPGGWARVLTSLGIIGGSAFAANLFFNRPTRDAPLDSYSAAYLNSTFRYLGGGIALTAAAAVGLHRSGFSRRIMTANPWVVLGVGLVASIGGMIGAQALPPGSPGKYACWALFNVAQAAVLSPMLFLNPAVLARAGVYTAGIVGSLCYVGATAKERQFLWMGGPLLAGVTVVALSGLAPLVLPATAFRALAVTEALSLYGGLGVFGAFVLYDMSKILEHARLAQMGAIPADPMRESIGLYLDAINIFTRLVAIMSNGQRRK